MKIVTLNSSNAQFNSFLRETSTLNKVNGDKDCDRFLSLAEFPVNCHSGVV